MKLLYNIHCRHCEPGALGLRDGVRQSLSAAEVFQEIASLPAPRNDGLPDSFFR